MTVGEQNDRAAPPRGPMAFAPAGGGSAADISLYADLNFDEDSIEGLLDAEDMQERRLRQRQQQRLLEDVDYWRKRAGWYDDDESMLEYNKGVYDTYYSLDDEYDSSASSSSEGGSKKGLGTALKALGIIAGIGVLFVLVRTVLRRRSDSSDKSKSLTSDDEGGHHRSGRSKSRSGSASRSASRHRRSSSRARSKSVSGRSRSKSVDRRSRSGRSRSRSRRKSGDDYDLMGDEEEGRSQRTSRSGRSRSRSGRTRSRSKARSSRQKEEMLV